MVSLSDRELIERARTGDRKAFGLLVDRYQSKVYNIALRLLRSQEEALDVSQEAFLEVFRKLHRLDASRSLGPYLFRTVHNLALNVLARKKHRSAPRCMSDALLERHCDNSETRYSEDIVERRLEAGLLQEAVDRLPLQYRSVITLRYIDDMSLSEMARILERPVNTVKTHLFRARNLLRVFLRGKEDDD